MKQKQRRTRVTRQPELCAAELKQLVAVAIRNYEGMRQSNVCLTLLSEGYYKDPVALMQLALAVLLDKPIYLLVPDDMVISGNLRSVAAGIEVVKQGDTDAYTQASKRLLDKAFRGN